MQLRVFPLALIGILAAVAGGRMMASIPAQASPAAQQPVLAYTAHDFTTRQELRIVAFGSSSTQGIGASSPETSYPSRLQAELSAALLPATTISVLNQGIAGEDAEDMLRRLPAILANRPDLVIWQTGTNDPLRGLPLSRFIELTRAGIMSMHDAGTDVMLMEPQSCAVFDQKPGSLAYRDAIRQIGAEMRVPVIRRYDLMQDWLNRHLLSPAQMRAADGLHMSDGGYALLAKAVARAILSDIASPPAVVAGAQDP